MQRYKMFPLEKHKTALKREFFRVNCHSSILTIYFRIFAEIFFRMKITDIFLAAVLILCMTACTENQAEKETNNMKNEECLICGAPLEYLEQDTLMECVLCHKQEPSKTRCTEGHYVCSDCHTAGMDSIVALCMAETSKDPIAILEKMMSQSFCHMHGPEHHVLVGAALLTAYNNAAADTMKVDLQSGLLEVMSRGRQVPGGACGYMGACGAAVSTGIFLSVVTRNTPLSTETWQLCNLMTARALEQVALNGGPRCCKRDSYLSILTAVDFVKEHLGVEMEKAKVKCSRSRINNQCIGKKCPFSPVKDTSY